MSVFEIARASATVLPLTHSVASELEAMAEQTAAVSTSVEGLMPAAPLAAKVLGIDAAKLQ